MGSKYVFGLALAVAALGVVRPVHASPLFEMIGGFGGQGALQGRNAGPSASSTYFNPALLPDAPSGLTAGVLVLNTEIGVRLDARPPGTDVPDVDASTLRTPGGQAYPGNALSTAWLRDGRGSLLPRPRQGAGSGHRSFTYEAVGLVIKIAGDRVAFGLYTLLPNKTFTQLNTFYANEKEAFFTNSLHPELYSDRMTSVSVASALGARITKTFSLGAGATVGVAANAVAGGFVANANHLEDLSLSINAKAKVNINPYAGFSWRPIKRLHLTGTVHAPQELKVKTAFDFVLGTGSQAASNLAFSFNYQPWQAGGGVGYDLVQSKARTITATASGLYARWSQYIDRQSTRPWGAYEWSDTITGAAGLRMEQGPLSMALDGQYKPTPVPLQTGRNNYVDNDRLGLAVAINYAFDLPAFALKLKVGLMLQGYRMIERHQTKLPTPTFPDGINRTRQLVADEVPDNATINRQPVAGRDGLQTNNPGFPGFSSSGWISSAGLYLTVFL